MPDRIDGKTRGRHPGPNAQTVILICDGRSKRCDSLEAFISAEDPGVCIDKLFRERVDDDNVRGRVWKLAFVAVDPDEVRSSERVTESALNLVRRLGGRSIPVICYGDGCESWPLPERCRILLTGARLLDSSGVSFERQVGAELQKRVRSFALDQRLKATAEDLGIVGKSPALMAALQAVERSARLSDMPVLLMGESGTGKELLARAVHLLDKRRQSHPFLALNCAALTKTLAEAELFGHRKGVFSGADRERLGFVRGADRGVLFLDEIGELDLDLQAKLLRVIQERRVMILGDAQETPVDVRIVAATHQDLRAMVARERFRGDLLHRLWVYPIEVPSLRRRREDIPALVNHFLAKHFGVSEQAPPTAGGDFLAALQLVELDGNVRQLENIVHRAVVMADPDRPLGLAELPPELWADLATKEPRQQPPAHVAAADESENFGADLNLARASAHHERMLVEAALRASGGNQSHAASLLGITARGMYNKLRKHGIAKVTSP